MLHRINTEFSNSIGIIKEIFKTGNTMDAKNYIPENYIHNI